MDSYYKRERIERLLKKRFPSGDLVHWDNVDFIVYVFKEIDYKNKKDKRLKEMFSCKFSSVIIKNIIYVKLLIDPGQFDLFKIDVNRPENDAFEDDE